MRFSQIPGQLKTKERLIASVQNGHVAHALMFYGAEGGAALPLALAFSTYINCEEKTDTDSCGKCASCYKIDKLTHPDFFYLFASSKSYPVEVLTQKWRQLVLENLYTGITEWLETSEQKQANIPVEEARILIKSLSYKPYEADFKIVLLWLPEYLNNAAANALLKVIEEPPNQTLFFIVTHNYELVLKTIQSRTQLIKVPNFSNDDLEKHLIEIHGILPEKASVVSKLANGNIAMALSLATSEQPAHATWFADWMRTLFRGKFDEILSQADQFDTFGKETQKLYLLSSIEMFRDLFLYKGNIHKLINRSDQDKDFIEKFTKHLNFQHFEEVLELLDRSVMHIDRNARAKILFSTLSFRLFKLIK